MITFQIKELDGVVYAVGKGEITIEQFRNFFTELYSNYMVNPENIRVVMDMREVKTLQFKYDDIQTEMWEANALLKSKDFIKVAVVAERDAVYGTARIAMSVTENTAININVFRSEKKAITWMKEYYLAEPEIPSQVKSSICTGS